MKFKRVELPYATNALEPYIDETTVVTHYEKHHATYEAKFNDAIKGSQVEDYDSIEEVMKNFNSIPDELRGSTRTAGGGLINHNIYWTQFVVDRELTEQENKYLEMIINKFGSKEEFIERIVSKGLSVFGSGWVWAVIKNNEIEIVSTPNQENPFMDGASEIILGIDVWEHAYYLKYKQDRKTYIENVLKLTLVK